MKSLLLFANDDGAFDARLEAAIAVTSAFESHLTCLQATPYDAFVLGDPFGGVYAFPSVIEEIHKAEQAHRARTEERLEREGVSWDWIARDGPAAQIIVDSSRLADMIVLSLPPHGGRVTGGPLSLTADVAIHARSPVLAVPVNGKVIDCFGSALVAWNGSAEASNALRFALPFLAKASAVNIVTVRDDEIGFPSTDASRYLARHGIASELHEWPRDGRAVAEAVRDAASSLGAAYVVLGAYGHSRIREAVLGGVTRNMLDSSEIPLLLGH